MINSISWYVGSGQRSSATSPSSLSAASRTLSIADTLARRLPEFSLQNFQKATDGQYSLQFKISGTNDRPKTDLAEKLIGGSVKEKVEDLLSGFFGTKPKKEDKKEKESEKKKEKPKTEPRDAPTRL